MSKPRVVCFGEVLLRLSSPSGEMMLQSPRLDVNVGGAEANVAVSLACLGDQAAMATVLPDNALGFAARDALRRHGVDTRSIAFNSGRMGLYFLTPGAVLRPSEVIYDRAASAFVEAAADAIDWAKVLDGAEWLHVSGVTPATGRNGADAALRAVKAARAAGVKVSFDGNYRAKLWSQWDGDGPAILRELMSAADLAFVDHRDIALLLAKRQYEGEDRRAQAAADAFEAFPNLSRMTCTLRTQHGVGHHDLSAVLFQRGGGEVAAAAYPLTGIVDRIGGGDAFAAGMLHGLLAGWDDQASLDFGLAASCLKHSIAGDFNLAGEAGVQAFLAGGLDVRR